MPVRAKDGKLFFDFLWRGVRCKEYTGLTDTPENRSRCEQKMQAVRRASGRKTFDYRQHFPRGSRLHIFYPDDRIHEGAAPPSRITLRDGIRGVPRSCRTAASGRTPNFIRQPGLTTKA